MAFFWRGRDSKRILELEESITKLRRDFTALEMEWTNFFDKARRLLMRVTKRAEIVEKADEAEQASEPGPTPISTNPVTGRLSDRQKEIQQQILRRRAGM